MVTVHRANEGYVIADHGGWLPGFFETEAGARRAGESLLCEHLQALQDRKNAEAGGIGGIITDADVAAALK